MNKKEEADHRKTKQPKDTKKQIMTEVNKCIISAEEFHVLEAGNTENQHS